MGGEWLLPSGFCVDLLQHCTGVPPDWNNWIETTIDFLTSRTICRQLCRLTICQYLCWVWQINQKQIQIKNLIMSEDDLSNHLAWHGKAPLWSNMVHNMVIYFLMMVPSRKVWRSQVPQLTCKWVGLDEGPLTRCTWRAFGWAGPSGPPQCINAVVSSFLYTWSPHTHLLNSFT